MRAFHLAAGLLAGITVVICPTVGSQPEPKETRDAPRSAKGADRSADEAAIRANVAAFVKAYNAGDAKAIAALFIPDGQIEDKDGNVSEGRASIRENFADIFADSPGKRIEVTVESIRFIGSDLAVEKGSTKETARGEVPELDRYTVVHVKRDGKWFMALARDEEGRELTNHEQLLPLAWLVGEWVDDGGNVVVSSTCRWSEDGNFLLQEFRLQVGGRPAMKVSQRIGWDRQAQRVRSWVFDSEGGFGESVWTREGDTWVIEATAVNSEGQSASATNTLVPAGKDAYVWRSQDRVIGGEPSAPVEVKVVRKLAAPNR